MRWRARGTALRGASKAWVANAIERTLEAAPLPGALTSSACGCELFGVVDDLVRAECGGSWDTLQRVLDAGTGVHSLDFLASRVHTGGALVAVTGDEERAAAMRSRGATRRARLVVANWLDETLFSDEEPFDLVLADYLLGSIDGFAPYFQSRLFRRLAPCVRRGSGLLVVVGLEPISPTPLAPVTADGNAELRELIARMARVRDAAITASGRRAYREFTCDATVSLLEDTNCFDVLRVCYVPTPYTFDFVRTQLNVGRNFASRVASRPLADALRDELDATERAADAFFAGARRATFGRDYVILCRRRADT